MFLDEDRTVGKKAVMIEVVMRQDDVPDLVEVPIKKLNDLICSPSDPAEPGIMQVI